MSSRPSSARLTDKVGCAAEKNSPQVHPDLVNDFSCCSCALLAVDILGRTKPDELAHAGRQRAFDSCTSHNESRLTLSVIHMGENDDDEKNDDDRASAPEVEFFLFGVGQGIGEIP
jgi:hypothetical protein